MSTTPRTDAQFIPHPDEPTTPVVQIHTEVIALRAENADLREQLDDWNNAVLHAKDYRADEQHCGCVPVLIGKVSDLERENAELRKDKARLREALDRIVALGARMPEDAEEVCIAKAAIDAAMEESK
jgi:regulator of replication initiation timing